MAYITPIHPPSSVHHALKLQFLEPNEDCLVVARANRLEFYKQSEDGLDLYVSKSIYGRVSMLNKLTPTSSSTDHLFIGTDTHRYFVVSWDPERRQLRTEKSFHDLADKTVRESQTGERCWLDPTGEFLVLEIYEGIITTIPMARKSKKKDFEPGRLGDPVHSRIPEFVVRSSAFLHGTKADRPNLALLYENYERTVRLQVRVLAHSFISQEDSQVEFEDAQLAPRTSLDYGANILIPITGPPYGVLILGERSISYFEEKSQNLITQTLEESTVFVAWERIDNQRYVLADDYGKLFLLMLKLDFTEKIQEWQLDVLGNTSRANVLVHLDAGRIFLGSAQGDSQVIQITESGSIDIVQVFSNIAPVLDFTIMDMGNRSGEGVVNEFSSGQARIVTGSGAWQDGSLRSVRSGVGLEEVGVLGEISNITNLFSLKSDPTMDFVDTLFVCFVNESRVFCFSEDGDVEETADFKGLAMSEQTLFVSNLPTAQLLQITLMRVRISDLDSGVVISEWSPGNETITAVASNETHIVLILNGIQLVALDIQGNLRVSTKKTLSWDQQLSCIALSPLLPDICVVGSFQGSHISVLDLKTLQSKNTVKLNDEDIHPASARSLIIAQLFSDQPPTLLVGMADGNLVTYSFDSDKYALNTKSTTILGTQEPNFKALPRTDGTVSVIALCEHPSVIYASEGRIVYSAVTAERATCVCSFDTVAYPGSAAIATTEELRIANLDTERKAHVQTLKVDETVRRVAYSPSLKAFGIGTIKRTVKDSVEVVTSHFKLADEVVFKEQDTFQLKPDELIEAVIRAELNDGTGDLAERFIIGTSYLEENPADEFRGRILVFEVMPDRKLKLIIEMPLKGPCRCLGIVDGKIVAALYKSIVVYSYDYGSPSTPQFTKRASYRTATVPIDICITGSLIAVADLTKSVSVVEYQPASAQEPNDKLVEVARHMQTAWGTAVADVDDNVWLESDAEGNLLVLQRDEAGVTEDDRRRLRVTSDICLGELVNRIRRVDVVSPVGSAVTPRAFLGTVEGSIYLFSLIAAEHQNTLMQLQTNLAAHVRSPGDIPFKHYRAYRTQVREKDEPERFVDGEVIERFLDLPLMLQEKVVTGTGLDVDSMVRLVESLRRLH